MCLLKMHSHGYLTLIWFIIHLSVVKSQAIKAIPADSFVESIGVNTHWLNGDVYTTNYTELNCDYNKREPPFTVPIIYSVVSRWML